MALTSALSYSIAGLKNAQMRISTVAANITNADAEGYTRKTIENNYVNLPGALLPAGGRIVGANNPYLERSVIQDRSTFMRNAEVEEALTIYQQRLGNVGDGKTIARSLDDLNSSFISLTASPTDVNLKYRIVEDASLLTQQIRQLSSEIQSLRQDAENNLQSGLEKVNAAVELIAQLNGRISVQTSQSVGNLGDIEDQRRNALNTLSEYLDIEYFYTSDNQVRIFTGSGKQILTGIPREFEYEGAGTITPDINYPDEINGIMLGNVDITEEIRGGKIGGWLDLRDQILVQEQAKLDELTAVMKDTVNAAINGGSSMPPRSEVRSDVSPFDPADPLTGTGTARIAVVDKDGFVQSALTIDASTYTTVNDFLGDLNSVAGLSASINPAGQLVIQTTDPQNGFAFNQNDTSMGADGQGLSQYFGLNNLFGGENATNIYVNDFLLAEPLNFSSGALSMSAVAGEQGLFSGDSSIAQATSEAMTNNSVSFDAAGDFAAQNNSIMNYATSFMSSAATRASNAEIAANATRIAFEAVRDAFNNETGVNVDEETARLLELETRFQASARVMQTVQTLFETLLRSVQ